MKHILTVAVTLLLFTSCREIYQIRNATRIGTTVAAGKTTSYVNDYSFDRDSIVAENHLLAIEKFMQYEDWSISQENETSSSFEYSNSPVSQTATSKNQSGSAKFSIDEGNNKINLVLRLRGNYGFGTKERSLKFYNELRNYLYGIEVDKTSKKKKKKAND